MIALAVVIGLMVGVLAGWLTFTYLETNRERPEDPTEPE